MDKQLFVCRKCGSSDIQVKAWVDLNNPTIESLSYLSDDFEDFWCNNCEDHWGAVTEEEYKKLKEDDNSSNNS